MDQQTILGVLIAFTLKQRKMLLTLELLMNDNKRLPQTPYDTRHRIRQLAYFRMIHEFDFVCRQSTHMDRQTFAILCHLLRIVAGLSSTEIVNVEEMVAMFLHVLAHDVKNRVIQQEFVQSGYPNAEGFLASYRGQRYHLQECRGVGNALTNAKVYFNMKHSSTRNVIEVISCSERLLNKPFPYYDELAYMFGRYKATGRFAVTFAVVESNESLRYEGFDMPDGNEEFPSMYSQGIDMSQEDVRSSRPSSALEGRVELSGSKRKRGNQQEDEIEVIHMALESLSVRTTNSGGLRSGLHAPLPMTTMCAKNSYAYCVRCQN
ncbi:putative nuclease HARBI1 [Cucumis melo var. makuwa]|uniref:Nuclease HARBI1 n=1 Tax=Cucumis melo var. makuwa TaxID=1194695 RepID=A0A5A7TLM6_CUCMM|nr:putative nuclease HARBI1 [Cucumis melo var. makuwa]TYK22896.1 putative nuclease HARBI1 [Cucumis melo var. makuwa]